MYGLKPGTMVRKAHASAKFRQVRRESTGVHGRSSSGLGCCYAQPIPGQAGISVFPSSRISEGFHRKRLDPVQLYGCRTKRGEHRDLSCQKNGYSDWPTVHIPRTGRYTSHRICRTRRCSRPRCPPRSARSRRQGRHQCRRLDQSDGGRNTRHSGCGFCNRTINLLGLEDRIPRRTPNFRRPR